ncbi:MAG: zinc ribbon domain-containing protein [Clostridia bacterium]|nr:zinc ribbon domain-containing protein [Clostridia bacterium]
MFCQNCGTQLPEDVKFCPECGAPVEIIDPLRNEPTVEEPVVAAAPVFEQPVYETPTYREPVVQSSPEAQALSTPILVFGILGLSFACIPYVNFLGIIFSAIAKKKVKQFLACGGVLSGKAKVGSILATVGLIIGIILTVIFAIIITFAIFGWILAVLGENVSIRGW